MRRGEVQDVGGVVDHLDVDGSSLKRAAAVDLHRTASPGSICARLVQGRNLDWG